jgi:RNA polymerase subunit RPABC4/transcription elongation factor Spt4
MSLKECRICHNKISSTAKPCPKCGEKDPFKSQKDRAIFAGIIILLAIVVMFYFRSL